MRYILICTVLILSTVSVTGQEYIVRGYFGITAYQGDLAPLPIRYSFSKGHPAFGVFFGGKISKSVTMGTRIMRGHLSGYDSESKDIQRIRRNLHFESDVYEIGLIAEYNLNSIIPAFDKFGLNIYYTTGINVFHFNPMAYYKGELKALIPLSTEGQGLSQFPNRKHYELTQINIPFGLGMEFDIADNLRIGLEISPRWTFTDYLDDVSTTYVNYDVLLESKGELSAALANRTGELLGTGPVKVPTGTGRGDSTDNDWYIYSGFHISYVIKPKIITKVRKRIKN